MANLWYNSGLSIIDPLWALRRMIQSFQLDLSAKAKLRLKWMDHYQKCKNAARTCRHFDISEATFWFWHKRYDPHDLKSLEDRSRKPRSSPQRTSASIRIQVLRIKRKYPRWGKAKLAIVLFRDYGINVSCSTVYRICKKAGLSQKYRTRKRPDRKKDRFPKDWPVNQPGDLIEVDTKYLYFNNIKWYQYTAIDVVSRMRYLEVRTNKDEDNGLEFVKKLSRKFPFDIKMIKSDNGGEFKNKKVRKYLKRNNIKYSYIHKASPDENGTVERSHRTDEEEFYSLGNFCFDFDELNRRITEHCRIYNYVRPHWGLNGRTPMQYLSTINPQYVLT